MAIESIHDDRLLTVREVAERLRVHPITVRRLIKNGRLRAVRVGRAVRVSVEELRKLSAERPRVGEEVATYHARSPERQDYEQVLRRRTPEEWRSIREAARRMISERDRMPPLGISTTELLREGRREIEERDQRRASGRS